MSKNGTVLSLLVASIVLVGCKDLGSFLNQSSQGVGLYSDSSSDTGSSARKPTSSERSNNPEDNSSSSENTSRSRAVSIGALSLSSAETQIQDHFNRENSRYKMTGIQEAVMAKEADEDNPRLLVWVNYTSENTSGAKSIDRGQQVFTFIATANEWEIQDTCCSSRYPLRQDFERDYKTIVSRRLPNIPALSSALAQSKIKEYYSQNNSGYQITSIQTTAIAKENEKETNRIFVWVSYSYENTSGEKSIDKSQGVYTFIYTGSGWEVQDTCCSSRYLSRSDFQRDYRF